MAAASATFVRGNQIFVRADNVPSGALLMDTEGNKSTDEDGSQRLTLKNVQKNNDLYKNGNDMAYGETFLFCIPKATAEQMDAGSEALQTSFTVSMNADRYNVYSASTTSSGVQPVIMVEPAVQKLAANMAFSAETPVEDKVALKILKTDENGAPLAGCTFQITYENNGQKTAEKTTDSNGEAIFIDLPLNTDVTIKETAAPEGYTLLPDKVVNTGSTGGKTIEVTMANSDDHVFKVHKVSSADNRNLMGAKFEVKGIDNDFVNTYTTDALGEFTIQGRDLPTGSFEVYEIAAPEGYATDGADIQTFSWDNTRDVTLTFKNAPLPGIQIYKYDKDSKEPLAGATFEIRRDGQVLQTVKTDVNGYAKVYNLPKGFYQVVEVEPPQGYLKDEVEHEVNVIGEYTTDSDGYIELEDDLEEGKYYAEEIEAAPGYIRDEEVKTFRVKRGETTEIVWENTPQQGQIQITKKSKDDNPINGLPAGTLLQGATFEIYDKAGNVVDTIVSNERGVAVSKLLPLGRYTIRETKAPAYYGASGETFEAEIEFSGQIVRLEVLNESVYTNVSIAKSGPKQVVPGQPIRWTVSHIANNSTVPLQSFYWRDTLPYQAVTLDKIVTGTYNARLSYKIVYRTNYNQNYRTLADNLSTAQNRTIQANPTALGLKSGEVVTDFMFVFGNVPAGFRCVETPYVYGNVRSSVAGTAFVNKADVGGLHNQQWIMSNDAWTTTIYRVTKPVLPQTGW